MKIVPGPFAFEGSFVPMMYPILEDSMLCRALTLGLVLLGCSTPAWAHGPGVKTSTSSGDISIPTTLNFCGQETVELYVNICNNSEAPVVYEAQLVDSSPAFDCNIAIVPDNLRWEVTKIVQPGQCAPYRITIYRPSELDQESVVCYWVRVGEVNNLNVWLGARLIDNRLACVNFYEEEGALFIHPQDPVTFEFDLVNNSQISEFVEYTLLAKGPEGTSPQSNLSFNNGDPAEAYSGGQFLEPGQSTRVSVGLEWTDPKATGMFELSVEAPVLDKGGYPQSEVFSLPVGNASLWSTPTAADLAPSARMNASTAPNPFNPRTTVSFTLERSGRTVVDVLDLRGRRVRRLLEQSLSAGRHDVTWDGLFEGGSPASSGTYFFRIADALGQVAVKGALIK